MNTGPAKTASKQEVEAFYDTFKEHQKKLGVNVRHRTIFKNLKKEGLKPGSKVLEVGCGIGTLSGLIINYVTQGQYVGADISPESIAQAQKTHPAKHATFVVNDMSEFTHGLKFDYIVLPDVLEHIPVEQHFNLFKVLSQVSHKDTVALINIPEPNALNWIRAHEPEKLQIIDQSLSMQDLLNNCYPHGFLLCSMNSYALHHKQPDYTCVVLKRNMAYSSYALKGKVTLATENMLSKM